MTNIILVHGFAATNESWFDIPKLLAAEDHKVDAVSLPDSFLSGLDDYVETVSNALPKSGKCVLIGHSMGGVPISQVAAYHPDRISKMIYVTALVPADTESAGDIMVGLGTSLDAIGMEFDRIGVGPTHPARRFPRPLALAGSFKTSAEFGHVEKHYVRCANDTIVSPPKQIEMIAKWPMKSTPSLDSGHIPQKEMPEQLARILLDLIR